MATGPDARHPSTSAIAAPGETQAAVSGQTTRRRRELVPSLIAAVVLLVVLGAAEVLALFDAHRATGPATMPNRIAGYSYLTGSVSDAPPGRAIAVYQHGFNVEFLDFPQAVLLGADDDTYRRVDLAEGRSGANSQGDPAPLLLAPDGGRIAVGSYENDGSLAVQDLMAGTVTWHPVTPGYSVVPLAWSPDGRYVAALELPEAWPYSGSQLSGSLVLFDLTEPKVIRFADLTGASTAAFAPDSRRLAVQQGATLAVVDLSGRPLQELPLPAGYALVPGTAWSPDGALLAIYPSSWNPDAELAFLDATGGTQSAPQPIPVGWGPPLGWTGPRSLLIRGLTSYTSTEGVSDTAIAEVDLSTGVRNQITWVDTDLESYGIGTFFLASGLLPEMRIRPAGDAARGPWPWWFRIVVGVPAALTAAALVLKLSGGSTPRRPAESEES